VDAVAKLKRDVESTLGARYTGIVDTHARRLLPFDWPAHAFAERLIGDVQQEFHDTFVDTTWPHCPAHPNHPLWVDDGVWRCNESGTAFAACGDLGTMLFNDAVEGLRRGDFDRLAPLFRALEDERCLILRWHAEGRFGEHPAELAEALSCACFLGADAVVRALIPAGLSPADGTMTGLDGVHWAVNRGQLATVRVLIEHGAPLETINMHGTTVLGTAVWSALNEPRPDHLAIIEALLDAGAAVGAAGYPSGDAEVDRLLERFGAGQ
jgi:hypothetical protein